jgi:hypothetical protein
MVADYELRDCGFESPCWIWLGAQSKGYPKVSIAGRKVAVHRMLFGRVPEGKEIDHLCRQTMCVRPDHMEAVRHRTNVQRGQSAKLTPEQVRAIRRSRKPQKVLAERYGVSVWTISAIRTGKAWKGVRNALGEPEPRTEAAKSSRSGVRGVHFDKRLKRFCLQLTVAGRHRSLGSYRTLEEARRARDQVWRTGELPPPAPRGRPPRRSGPPRG